MSVQSNIWKMYVIQILRWFMMAMPVFVLFYQENDLSLKEVFLLQTIFAVASLAFEIPSGYFSDLKGRKGSIVLACIFGAMGFLIYSFSFDFWGFLIAEIALALGWSFMSGADSALLYDSLLEMGKADDYKKNEGRLMAMGNFSEGTAAILGGFLALVSLRTPFYATAIIMLLTIPMALSLKEPNRITPDNSAGNMKAMIKIIRFALSDHKEIKWLIIYGSIVGAATHLFVWVIQPFQTSVGVPLALFGVAWAAYQFFVGIISTQAYKIENWMGPRNALIALPILAGLSWIALGVFKTPWALPIILIPYFVRGLTGPLLKDYVNKLIGSDIRATILSVKAMGSQVIFAALGPLIGYATDTYSLSVALGATGVTFLVTGLLSLLFLRKYKVI